ncbi:MAG: HAD family hydrolase [Treponema sp.]|nr:HAD family hydrolase [Treponema sp.]
MNIDHPVLRHRRQLEGLGFSAPWLALFDIDSTLMDTTPRNLAILAAARGRIPGLDACWDRLDLSRPFWDIGEPLRRAGIEDRGLFEELRAFWTERFFTDEWLIHDRPYPGAAELLADLKNDGFTLAYLTGRHSPGMEVGTRRSFLEYGLPAGPEEIFFFKPDFAMEDEAFKASVCDELGRRGTLVVAIDNEPANSNLFHRAFPRALAVWLDTVTSPLPATLDAGIERRGPDIFRSWS